ncbi:MAG TPA: DUF6541 family protein [Acidimicrobiia bacterium]
MTIVKDQTSTTEPPEAPTGSRRSRRRPTFGRRLRARLAHPEWSKLVPLLLVALPIAFNLFVLRTELRHVVQLNDTTVHISMVRWAEQRLNAGQLVFDGWYPRLQLGLAQFHHYQSLPHIVAGAFATVFGAERTVTWSAYLLLSFWPLCVYWTVRLFGFNRWTAATTAILAPLMTSVTGYGYEHFSYVWRGNGIWSQLWGMWLFPLALVFTWRAVSKGKGYAVAALFLALTIACHFLTGYLAIIGLGIWVLLQPREILRRIGRAVAVGLGGALAASWVIVPLLLDSKWALRTQFNVGTFWFDSYGGKNVVEWLFTGKLFDGSGQTQDLARFPIFSILVGVGVILCGLRFLRDERARAILTFFVVCVLLLCGRDTIGFVINLLPGSQDLLIHRFIIGVQLSGLLLAGLGASWLTQGIYARVRDRRPKLRPVAVVAVLTVLGLLVIAPAWRFIASFDAQGAAWINQQRVADGTNGKDFEALAREAASAGGGRVYAGSASNGGRDVLIGSVPGYSYLLDADVDELGFTLRTLSLSADAETAFNDANPADYDLFDVRWVILPTSSKPGVPAHLVSTRGRWNLWQVDTSGYLEVVDTTPAITADRTNLLAQTKHFLSSHAVAEHQIPVIAFGGDAAAAPTNPSGTPKSTPAGSVTVQYSRPDDGVWGGEVVANRPSVVMLKSTYDPRIHVTVDGKPAKTQMLAPSYVGVAVPAGTHRVEFQYEPFGYYWVLFLIGALALIALAVVPRYGSGWIRAVRGRR